jgi:Domain of unknown function (DUF4260)
MATSSTPRHTTRLLLDIDRTPAGRLEGRVRPEATDSWTIYSGVLELLKVLEELLDHHELPATHAGTAEGTDMNDVSHPDVLSLTRPDGLAHVGTDRALGYGLTYGSQLQHTHLGDLSGDHRH